MSPTKLTHLLALAIAGGALAYAAEVILVRMGQPTVIPPLTLALTLALLGVIIPALAWPIRQMVRRQRPIVIDPFYATRVLLVSKAGSLSAAGLAGATVGALGFLLGRVVVVWPQVVETTLTLAGGVVMLVGALIAERWCLIPPGDEAETSPTSEGEPA